MPGNGMPTTRTTSPDLAAKLTAWQETADANQLAELVMEARPQLEEAARRTLRRLGIGDWSAVDDAVSLVLDHLRRLPQAAAGERAVAQFDVGRTAGTRAGDCGLAYLLWLARERALDIARHRRRQARRCELIATAAGVLLTDRARDDLASSEPPAEAAADPAARLHAALDRLEPRLRTVVEMLLTGKSQAAIAHVLEVCEGTVSRLRGRAIAELKRVMTEQDRPAATGHVATGHRPT
jgi:RNA polymerase sigma factor (sigma-70 family)